MNDMDFILDDDQSFEGLFGEELAGYGSGDALDACRFLALTTTLTDDETEEAALELQTRGISLDISGLPRGGASGQMAARQDLEVALLKRGELPGKLEARPSAAAAGRHFTAGENFTSPGGQSL